MCLLEAKKLEYSCHRDGINSIPDEILAKILSYLPTKRAVSTCVLSKRWRNLFPLMSHVFASQHHFYLNDSELFYPGIWRKKEVHQRFRDFVEKTLSGCNSIKKLSLNCQDGFTSFPLADKWIGIALGKGLVDLDLRLTTEVDIEGFDFVMVPRSTVFKNKTLVKLTLGIDIGLMFSCGVSLPVLKSLFFHGVCTTCEHLCHRMLPGCPILEELSLEYYFYAYKKHEEQESIRFAISHKTLKRLTVHHNSCVKYSRRTEFDTPSLVYFDYSGHAPLIFNTTANFLDSLVEAKLDVDVPEMQANVYILTIIKWMTNVKSLTLSCTTVKEMYTSGKVLPSFVNLVKLSIESNTKEGWLVLPRLLNKSPKLETLILKGLHCIRNEGVYIGPSAVKVLEIYGFRGSVGEFTQSNWFLCQMQLLRVMKVQIDAVDVNKKLQLISDLLALPPKGSSKCQIQFL